MTFYDLDFIKKRHSCIRKRILYNNRLIQGFDKYAGSCLVMGAGLIFNTMGSSRQLIASLAMSDYSVVDDLINSDITPKDFDPKNLLKAKVLSDLKILDLGCGILPTFARVSRALGAEVYTIDGASVADFKEENKMYKKAKQLESKYHIQLDLRDNGVLEILTDRTGGDFDLVTASFIGSGASHDGVIYYPPFGGLDKMCISLLREKGIYYNDIHEFKQK